MAMKKPRLLPCLIFVGLASARATSAATFDVELFGETFSPSTVQIRVGDTVRWLNRSGFHNVVATGGSFSSGAPSADTFTFAHTFNSVGTFAYFCEVHLAMGMTGTVIVAPAEAPIRGELRFGQLSYSVGESAGESGVTITVQRVNGDDGAVAVSYAASAGSAMAGSDFTPVSGALGWADHDDDPKSFTVMTLDDSVVEAPESFALTLASPTGGAVLGEPAMVDLTILDDDGGQPGDLTEAESRCDGQRLAGLLDRLEVQAPNTSKIPGINLALTETGDFAGLAYTGNGPGTPERHLAFSTNPEETTLLRNPTRPQLGSLSATRNDLNSDVVAPSHPELVRVSLNPTLASDPASSALLVIDNATLSSSARPGRGLAGVLARCEDGLTAADVFLFRVLTKIVRAEASGARSFEIALYRGPSAGTFRIDARPIGANGAPLGRISAELEADVALGVALGTGTLRVLPACTGGVTVDCTTLGAGAIMLVKAVASGLFYPTPPPVRATAGGPAVPFLWSEMLQDTSWSQPQ
jgi:plastocyanin